MPGGSSGAGAGASAQPATSVVTWPLPLLTGVFAASPTRACSASAFFFFLTVFIYGLIYRVMSLNAPKMPLGLARLRPRRRTASRFRCNRKG